MALEGQSVGGSITSKCSLDINAGKYCNFKKISMETTGTSIVEVDIPNVCKNTTFMLRFAAVTQCDG